ncbi:MAG: serine/threonine protein kinase [Actinobacteria bacterium]|nr:serine/threonine protein kinase [Actinomycetota bacterium]
MPVAAQDPAPYYADWRDRYQLAGKIGSGAFAEVFEAYDATLDEAVALKIVPDGRALSARIVREVEAAAALDHPNIVALYDWFSDDEGSVLVWELVRGESLDRVGDWLGDGDVVAIGVELLDALAYAHSQGIVHRDVKPQNVMLGEDGHVKVMDFGIAHLMDSDTLTGDGDVIGTIAYMSPEQAQGRRVQPPSDVYSAGMVLYELLAGAHPLRGSTPAETLSNVAAARLPSLGTLRPDLPAELVTLIDAACAPRPGERPTPSYLSDALDDLLRSGRLQARRLQQARSLVRPLGRASAFAERAGGAALSAVTGAVALGALPAYPQSWTLPIVALSAAVWAVAPAAGLAFLLGALAFPLFNVSVSVGAAYLAFAVALFLVTRSRPVVALWPAFALLLAPAYLTLLAPAAAALLGRLRGPLTAAWAGVGTVVFLLLTRAPRGPFTLEQPRRPLADEVAAAGDPFTAAGRVLAHALAAPALLQALLWAALAAALALALTGRRLETRLWIWSLSFAAIFAAYRIVPVVVWDYPAHLWPLVWSVAAPAAVILLPLVLTTGEAPEEGDDGDLQEGE